ncbi:hypothetical protein BJ878DRAFT_311684 [Calycina marina]|uniref:F-box domain-containing protein n=1 Tax=Calycina marina TaxID=1763456 RepID=A0A9P7YVL5_9HELO|nr:hypothetical protein BJ878DRAFT_311684 [Calycina marina]
MAESLANLPTELLLQILSNLDIPDLLALSRTSHELRTLTFDPILHLARLRYASLSLNAYIPIRPPLTYLLLRRIYVTRTTLAARQLGRNLVRIQLSRRLDPARRLSREALVARGVLPRECLGDGSPALLEVRKRLGWDMLRVQLGRKLKQRPSAETLVRQGVLPEECFSGRVAPALIGVKKRVERERVKDILRGWVDGWRKRGGERQVEQKMDVRRLAIRFTAKEMEELRGGSRKLREEPTRAKVLGLRRFWEKVGRDGN